MTLSYHVGSGILDVKGYYMFVWYTVISIIGTVSQLQRDHRIIETKRWELYIIIRLGAYI